MVARARWGTLTVIATNEAVAILSFELTIYVLFALFEGNVHVSAGAHTAKVRTRVSCAVVVVTFLERPKCGSLHSHETEQVSRTEERKRILNPYIDAMRCVCEMRQGARRTHPNRPAHLDNPHQS